MADSIGIKIGVEGEKEFKRALADINQSFKVLGSEMKLVESAFDKNDRSVEALTARHEALNKSMDAQKNKIASLESALRNAADSFGETDRRTQQWAVQLNNAKAELNGMERELKDSAEGADKLGDELKEAGTAAEQSGGKFAKLGGILKTMGTAMGTVALAAGAAAVKLGKEVVQQYSELEQNLGGSEAVFGAYASRIQKTGEEAYKNLGLSQSQYLATANKMGALFQGSGIEQERSLELTTKAMQRAADMASVMGVDMEMAMESVAGAAKGNFTMMDNLGVSMNATNIEAYALSKGLDFVWSSATNAEKAEVAMQMFFENTQQYAGNFEREATQTISGSIGLFQAALGSFTAGLGNANADMTNLTENLADAFSAVVDNIVPVLENIVQALPTAMDAILGAVSELLPMLLEVVTGLFTQVLETLLTLLPELIPAAVDAIITITTALIDNLPLLVEAAVQLMVALATGLGDALPELIPAIVAAVVLIVTTLIDNLDKIMEASFAIMGGLAEGLLNALPVLLEAMPEIITAFVGFITDNLPEIITLGIQLVVQLSLGLIQAIPQLVSVLPQITGAILEGIGAAVVAMNKIGVNIVTGLWEGIQSMGDWIRENVSNFFSGIVEDTKNMLGIHSPSTVFAGIGENMGLGLEKGFTDAMKDVEKSMETAVPTDLNIAASFPSGKDVLNRAASAVTSIVRHTGVIRVEGINDTGALMGVTDILIDRLRQEVRA